MSVLLRFPSVEALRVDLLLQCGDGFFFTAPERALEGRQTVALHLLLPQGQFASLQGYVRESTARRGIIAARHLNLSLPATLRAAIGEQKGCRGERCQVFPDIGW